MNAVVADGTGEQQVSSLSTVATATLATVTDTDNTPPPRRATPRTYEHDLVRVRALYRLPVTTPLDRILEVQATRLRPVDSEDEAQTARLRPTALFGGEATIWDARAPVGALSRPGGYQLLVLHRTLDVLAHDAEQAGDHFSAHDFIGRLSGALAPRGWIAGCVANRLSLATMLGRDRRRDSTATFSMRTCRRVLERAGLTDIEVFGVFPDAMAPTALLSPDAKAFKDFSLRELDSRRQSLSGRAYFARRAFLGTAVGRWLSADIFFWGRKA